MSTTAGRDRPVTCVLAKYESRFNNDLGQVANETDSLCVGVTTSGKVRKAYISLGASCHNAYTGTQLLLGHASILTAIVFNAYTDVED